VVPCTVILVDLTSDLAHATLVRIWRLLDLLERAAPMGPGGAMYSAVYVEKNGEEAAAKRWLPRSHNVHTSSDSHSVQGTGRFITRSFPCIS